MLKSQSKKIAEMIISARETCGGTRINGEIVQWNSSNKSSLWAGGASIPVKSLANCMTDHEIAEAENLPRWDGRNDYLITSAGLRLVKSAIARYKGVNIHSRIPVDEQVRMLSACNCSTCVKMGHENY